MEYYIRYILLICNVKLKFKSHEYKIFKMILETAESKVILELLIKLYDNCVKGSFYNLLH